MSISPHPLFYFLPPPFSSAPGVLPVPDGPGRSAHRLNKITSLKYLEDPGMVFFLGLFSLLNLNKRVITGKKGVQVASTWNFIQGLIYIAEEDTKERHGFKKFIA